MSMSPTSLIYLIPPFLILLSEPLLFRVKTQKEKRIFLSLFFFVVLCLIFTIRSSSVGVDTQIYYKNYISSKNLSLQDIFSGNRHFELGYTIFETAFAKIGCSFRLFLFFSSFIIYIPPIIFLANNSKNLRLSFILYYCFGLFTLSMSALRQSIAIGIIAIGLICLKKGDIRTYFSYFCFVILASLFHQSALIAIFLPFFGLIKCSNLYSVFLKGALCLLFIVICPYIYSAFYQIVSSNSIKIFSSSSNAPMRHSLPETAFVYLLMMLMSDLLQTKFLFRIQKFDEKIDHSLVFPNRFCNSLFQEEFPQSVLPDTTINGFVLFQFIFVCFGQVTNAFPRLGFYGALGFCLLLPNSFSSFTHKKTKVLYSFFCCLLLVAYFVIWTLRTNYLGLLPYEV